MEIFINDCREDMIFVVKSTSVDTILNWVIYREILPQNVTEEGTLILSNLIINFGIDSN